MSGVASCNIPQCDKPAYVRGWCAMHYTRWRRHGDAGYLRVISTSYVAVHKRLNAERGKATDYPCADCGRPARQWSYKGGGGGMPYSADFDDYEPRCSSCHKKLDRPRKRCSVDGCDRPHVGRGMCRNHYMRWWTKQKQALQSATRPTEGNK